MYIVYWKWYKHSAWNTRLQAQEQAELLKESGYRHLTIKYENETDEGLPNGHYFTDDDVGYE